MRLGSVRADPEIVPAISTGALLLLSGLVLLLAGDAVLPSDAAARSLWTALVGLLVVLVGLLYLLVRVPEPHTQGGPRPVAAAPEASPAPAVAPATSVAAPAAEETPAPVALTRAEPARPSAATSAQQAVQRAAALAATAPSVPSETPAAGDRSALPTSIPGAYLRAVAGGGAGPDPWSEMAPPIAAALPFSPGFRRAADGSPPWDESSDSSEREAPRLELELARLRARVRELEVPLRAPAPTVPAARATPASWVAREPPTPPSRVAAGPRGCVGCGTGLAATGPSHLCWGCGRPLCSTCYWRYGPGPGLHRCPDCLARSPTDAISGARFTSATGAVSRGPSSAPSAPPR